MRRPANWRSVAVTDARAGAFARRTADDRLSVRFAIARRLSRRQRDRVYTGGDVMTAFRCCFVTSARCWSGRRAPAGPLGGDCNATSTPRPELEPRARAPAKRGTIYIARALIRARKFDTPAKRSRGRNVKGKRGRGGDKKFSRLHTAHRARIVLLRAPGY